jgi:tetratricopeptide (TPR) repeat protein
VTGSQIGAAWTKALELAEGLENTDYQLRALSGLWSFHTAGGRHRIALQFAGRFRTLAVSGADPHDQLLVERMIGVSLFYRGNLSEARRHIERLLAADVASDRRRLLIRFQLDLQVMARLFLARIEWLQGFPDQALRAVKSTVETAQAANHAWSLGYALALGACPIAMLVGDLAAAEHYVGMLVDHSATHSLPRWRAFGRSHQGALAIKRGDLSTGLQLVRAALDELNDAEAAVPFTAFPFTALLVTEAFGQAGQVAEALAAVDQAIDGSMDTEEHWRMAELLRVKAELLLLQSPVGAAAPAEDHFRQALGWARRQGALTWELRAATSLARLLRDQGRSTDGEALLRPVYDRFTEGFGTADLKTAKALLNALQS